MRRRNLGFNEENPWSQEKEEELRRRNLGFNEENPWSQEKEEELRRRNLGFNEENPWSQAKEEEKRRRNSGFIEKNPCSQETEEELKGGTKSVQYQPKVIPHNGGRDAGWSYLSISYMPQFNQKSHEELRMEVCDAVTRCLFFCSCCMSSTSP